MVPTCISKLIQRQPLKVCGAGYAELQNHNDFVQIKYYQDKKTGVWITQGDSDVTQIYHCSNDKVYFARAEGNGAERHVYELNLHDFGTTSLITEAVKSIESLELPFTSSPQPRGYYEASFSPLAKFYRLSYDGPEFPWEIVKETKSASIISTLKTCDSEKKLLDYEYPQTEYNTIKNENGDEMNMKIIYPPNFNVHSTYPVMMQVYGGPESQTASKQYSIDFLNRVALNGVIGVQVDGRGTGFKGRKFLISVSKNLGHFELQDQIFAAKWLAKQPFVDAARIGIWGWSYGGYLTARAIEADAHVFKFGISVAPVTNWLYYDSIYTERFMKTPIENPDGYDQSSIKDMDGFENSKFLLIHGTADSNAFFNLSQCSFPKLCRFDLETDWCFKHQIHCPSLH